MTECKHGEELKPCKGMFDSIYTNILDNSWIKQPNLAFGATLALLSTVVSRKLAFQGMSPNLYILNIAPSGSGKDAPQQLVKKYLIEIGADSLLGAGDYVSDASLMDSLDVRPTRLDIMDEAGGILKTVNKGKSDYNGKMADILAELYTSSNTKYLGRATAEGNKGSCYRPNINILASTTPTGFSEGISIQSIEKGLMGRFLIFQGDPHNPAKRLRSFPKLHKNARDGLLFWFGFNPESESEAIAGIPQNYVDLKATAKAEDRLDAIFDYFDILRRDTDFDDPKLPIIARLYQQMVKLVIIAAASRTTYEVPTIHEDDVEWAFNTILFYYNSIQGIIDKYIFSNNQERESMMVLNLIKEFGNLTKRELYNKTRNLSKRQRDSIIDELIESGNIVRDVIVEDDTRQVIFFAREN